MTTTARSRAPNWRTALICTAALAATVGPAAAAEAADTPTITNPESGSRHLVGYAGPVAVDFTGVTAFGDYTVSVTGPDAYSWQVTWTYDGSQHTNSWTFDPVPVQGTYHVSVEDQDTAEVAASEAFHVDDVHVTESRLASTAFFPLEHDGHRDFAHFAFRTDIRARDTVHVTNRRGRVIRRVRRGALAGERLHRWSWDGSPGAASGPRRSSRSSGTGSATRRRSASARAFVPPTSCRWRPAAIVWSGTSASGCGAATGHTDGCGTAGTGAATGYARGHTGSGSSPGTSTGRPRATGCASS